MTEAAVDPREGGPPATAEEAALAAQGLTKQYGRTAALIDCTFSVRRGEVFGLLGPNGAGKTTLIRLVMGFLRPTAGQARLDGLDCRRQSLEVRRRVAYLPGEPRPPARMRGRDALELFADLRPDGSRRRAAALARRLDLDLRPRVAAMSTGMRQKLVLAATLSIDAPVWILDEPTNHLDPTVRAEVLQLVAEARAAGRTVLMASHVLAEVEQACDRVGVLAAGRLVGVYAMAAIRRRTRIVAELVGPPPPPPSGLGDRLRLVRQGGRRAVWEADGDLRPVLQWLASLPLNDLRIEPAGLRSVYERHHPARPAPSHREDPEQPAAEQKDPRE